MHKKGLTALLALFIIAAGIYGFNHLQSKIEFAKVEGTMAAYLKQPTPKDIPPFTFVDATGAEKDLSVLKGKVTLLNLWATWCGPCRKEMPALSRLQKALGGADFQVVELSEDLKGYEASAAYLKEVSADNLTLFADPKTAGLAAVNAPGLPVTLLLNREGKEIGRLLGPAPWDGAEAMALIKAAIDAK
jgi:thiol-disulfide isomerase/thioredoxin